MSTSNRTWEDGMLTKLNDATRFERPLRASDNDECDESTGAGMALAASGHLQRRVGFEEADLEAALEQAIRDYGQDVRAVIRALDEAGFEIRKKV